MEEPLLQIGNIAFMSWTNLFIAFIACFIYLTCNVLPAILTLCDFRNFNVMTPLASFALLTPIIGTIVGAAVIAESPLLTKILGPCMIILAYAFIGTCLYYFINWFICVTNIL